MGQGRSLVAVIYGARKNFVLKELPRMPTLEWIGKEKVINHHQDVPFRVLERQYSFDTLGQHQEDNGSQNPAGMPEAVCSFSPSPASFLPGKSLIRHTLLPLTTQSNIIFIRNSPLYFRISLWSGKKLSIQLQITTKFLKLYTLPNSWIRKFLPKIFITRSLQTTPAHPYFG